MFINWQGLENDDERKTLLQCGVANAHRRILVANEDEGGLVDWNVHKQSNNFLTKKDSIRYPFRYNLKTEFYRFCFIFAICAFCSSSIFAAHLDGAAGLVLFSCICA